MRIRPFLVLSALCALVAIPAAAELQNVEVGGELRIRGNWYSAESGFSAPFATKRNANSMSFVEQRTRLNVTADFTNDISAFIEIDSYDIWGEDFRSEYITGIDGRASSVDDVEIYQAYIEMRESWGWPLTVRIGRQELMFGSEWLVGNNDTSSFFRGLSFDGIRAWYDFDNLTVNAFWTKLAENSPIEEDGDVDFYGVYASYTGFQDITIDAYWLFLRDARGSRLGFPFDTPNTGVLGYLQHHVEGFFGVDQYERTSKIHTFGLRAAGTWRGFDFEAEAAWQRLEALNAIKLFFSPDPATSLRTPYGDHAHDAKRLGVNIEVGYTFDTQYQPRVYLGYAWLEGSDRRRESFGDWLHTFYPFHKTDASISFNRLFSDWEYSEFLANTDLSNAHVFRGGVSARPTEKTEVLLSASYFVADAVTATNNVFGIPFRSVKSDDSIGWEVGLYLTYDYSEDLAFKFGYAHFFAGDGLGDNSLFLPRFFPKIGGNFIAGNGLVRVGGVDKDDADYVFAETRLKF